MKTILRTLLLTLAALLTAASLVSCGSAGNDDDMGSASRETASSADSKTGGDAEPVGPEDQLDAGLDKAVAPDVPGEGREGDDGAARTAVQDRAVISNGSVSLRSKDVAKARFEVRKVVDAHAGEISEEETSTGDKGAIDMSRLEVRVPSKDFDATMTELAGVAELLSSSRSSEDVTTQVIDNEVRIRAQTKSLDRIEALLARATTIQEIVAIEAQLTRRQAELDSLKSQQAYLADQTSLSTITVFLEKADREDKDEDDSGFLAGLKDGWDAMTDLGTGSATFAGAVLPFVVLLALLGWPAWLVTRSFLRRRPTPAPMPSDA